jgi:hypothetical protein
MNKNYNITKIEGALWNLCKTAFDSSMKVYAGSRPTSVASTLNSFCVVAVPGNVTDYGALGKAYVTIYLYARNLSDGTKNGTVLNTMHDTLFNYLPYSTNDDYFFDFSSEASFPDSIGFHIVAINLHMMTKRIV